MTKKRSLSFSKFISANRFLLLTCLLIVGGGLYFALSRQTPQINMAGGSKCSEYKGKESCQSTAGCYWNGYISEGGTGCEQTTVPEAQNTQQLAQSSPDPFKRNCALLKAKESCQSTVGCYWEGDSCRYSINATQRQIGQNLLPSPPSAGLFIPAPNLYCRLKRSSGNKCKSCNLPTPITHQYSPQHLLVTYILQDGETDIYEEIREEVVNPKNTSLTCTEYTGQLVSCANGTLYYGGQFTNYLSCH